MFRSNIKIKNTHNYLNWLFTFMMVRITGFKPAPIT